MRSLYALWAAAALLAVCSTVASAMPSVAPAALSPADSEFQFKVRPAGCLGRRRPAARTQTSLTGRVLRPKFKQVGSSLTSNGRVPVEDDEMTYRIIQTVKGSYSSLGPLSCESTCAMKAPTPVCRYEKPDCAIECKDRCLARAATRFGFRHNICMEGCQLFCEFEPKDCCAEKKKDEL